MVEVGFSGLFQVVEPLEVGDVKGELFEAYSSVWPQPTP